MPVLLCGLFWILAGATDAELLQPPRSHMMIRRSFLEGIPALSSSAPHHVQEALLDALSFVSGLHTQQIANYEMDMLTHGVDKAKVMAAQDEAVHNALDHYVPMQDRGFMTAFPKIVQRVGAEGVLIGALKYWNQMNACAYAMPATACDDVLEPLALKATIDIPDISSPPTCPLKRDVLRYEMATPNLMKPATWEPLRNPEEESLRALLFVFALSVGTPTESSVRAAQQIAMYRHLRGAHALLDAFGKIMENRRRSPLTLLRDVVKRR